MMIKLRYKLTLFNLVSKLLFAVAFLAIMPYVLERFNLIHTDNELIDKRERIIDLISLGELDPLVLRGAGNSFGSYNILKEEYISLEPIEVSEHWNFIEVTQRMVDEEIIDYRVLNYSFIIDGETYLLEIGKSLSSIRQTEKFIRIGTLYFLLIFVLLTLFSDISFARLMIRPLEAITRKLRNNPSPANYDHDPVKTSTQDFHYLDKNLSHLMRQIEELFQKEKQYTANISHELLTPVSILRSKLENLLMDPQLSDDASAKVEESLKTLHRLKVLVNSLLLIARIEASQYLKGQSQPINTLLDEICEELHPILEDAQITLLRDYTIDLTLEDSNKGLLFTMFYNVVNNAVKFTPAGGTISIHTGVMGKRPLVTIADTGPGMSKEQRDVLFERFAKKIHKEGNGTGIGLAITRSIADFHHIGIEIQTEINKGTKFTFVFPEN